MTITLNGQQQTLALGTPPNGTPPNGTPPTGSGPNGTPPKLADFIASLGLAGDRVAVEQNGQIVPRANWPTTSVSEGDRFEIVHFVGGGSGLARLPVSSLLTP